MHLFVRFYKFVKYKFWNLTYRIWGSFSNHLVQTTYCIDEETILSNKNLYTWGHTGSSWPGTISSSAFQYYCVGRCCQYSVIIIFLGEWESKWDSGKNAGCEFSNPGFESGLYAFLAVSEAWASDLFYPLHHHL